MINRLHLDWTIESSIERSKFIENFLQKLPDPTEKELDLMAKYILWGKDEDGLNSVQKGFIELETRGKSWTKDSSTESLESLLESPTFNENQFSHYPTKIQREVFNRDSVYAEAPPHILEEFESIWRQIDELEYQIYFYEIQTQKHNRPLRSELKSRLQKWNSDLDSLEATALHWTPLLYSRSRHRLTDLRTQQYSLRDNYSRNFSPNVKTQYHEPDLPNSYTPLPLGLTTNIHGGWVFRPIEELNPALIQGRDMAKFWGYINGILKSENFDFREEEHLEKLCKFYLDFGKDENSKDFIDTFNYYRKLANLPPPVERVIDLKILGLTNEEIRQKVNSEFGMNYTVNYISTLFHLRGLKKIADAAKLHEELVMNLWVEENFKKCRTCGKLLLRTTDNFVKRRNAADGLSTQCKVCDKKKRGKL